MAIKECHSYSHSSTTSISLAPNHNQLVKSKSRNAKNLDVLFKHKNVSFNFRDIPVQTATPYTDAVRTKKVPKNGHIKRPLNCFMLYSFQERPKAQLMHSDESHSEISKILGTQWKALNPEQQKPYREEAQSLKQLHDAQFPRYKYKPVRKGRSAARKRNSSKGSTVKTATCTTFINRNLRAVNRSHFSDSAASVGENAVNGAACPTVQEVESADILPDDNFELNNDATPPDVVQDNLEKPPADNFVRRSVRATKAPDWLGC